MTTYQPIPTTALEATLRGVRHIMPEPVDACLAYVAGRAPNFDVHDLDELTDILPGQHYRELAYRLGLAGRPPEGCRGIPVMDSYYPHESSEMSGDMCAVGGEVSYRAVPYCPHTGRPMGPAKEFAGVVVQIDHPGDQPANRAPGIGHRRYTVHWVRADWPAIDAYELCAAG